VRVSSQDYAAWFSAVGTVGALVVALYQVFSGVRQDRFDRRRAQACKLSAWPFENDDIIVVNNHSGEPVYDAVVTFVVKDRDGRHATIPGSRYVLRVLPPGSWKFKSPVGWRGMCAYPGVELAFSDANGRHWLRTSRGHLKLLRKTNPIKYYNIILPYISARLTPIERHFRNAVFESAEGAQDL